MNFIVFQPKITKDFILSKINQESIMQHYTGLNVNSKKLALSPLRNDHKVTVSIYKSRNGVLYLHDFATGDHLDCWNVVMRLYNCNFYEALKIIAQDFNLVDSTKTYTRQSPKIVESIKETESAKIQVQIKDFTEEELEWWKSFGINKRLLKKYHVFSLQHVFLNGNLRFSSTSKFPIYGYYFGKDKTSKELWKIYFPFNKDKGIRFLNNLPKKKLQGYKQLPEKGDLLVITKSMKDVMSLNGFGIAACAPNSETLFVNDKQLAEFKQRFKHILVVYDQDRSGLYNMCKIRKSHPELNYFVIPRKFGSKDFTDLIRDHGIEKVKTLVSEFFTNYKFK